MARILMKRRAFPRLGVMMTLAASTLLSYGCPEAAEVCDPCPPVGGIYVVEAEVVSGECHFLPMLIGGSVLVEQTPDETGSKAIAWVLDPVSDRDFPVSGDVLEPHGRDPEGAIAGLALTGQTVRQATELSGRLVTLRVTLSATIAETDEGPALSGALTTIDITPPDGDDGGRETGCAVTVGFTAYQ